MSIDKSPYEKILYYLSVIRKKPKKDVKFFFFEGSDTSELKFFVEAKFIKLLPRDYSFVYDKEDCWLCFDPSLKEVMYYGWDVVSYASGERTEEVLGHMEWDKVEQMMHSFLVMRLSDLTDSANPYTDSESLSERKVLTENKSNNDYRSIAGYHHPKVEHNAPVYGSYGSQAYKDKEKFVDTLSLLVKDHKHSKALDYVKDTFSKMKEEKKYKDIDFFIRSVNVDKLTPFLMIHILNETKDISNSLQEINIFSIKVKDYFKAMKSSKIDLVFKN